MSFLSNLKVVVATRKVVNDPVVSRRQRLAAKIDEQIVYAQAVLDNAALPTTIRTRTIVDAATGQRSVVEQQRNPRIWFWTNDAGAVNAHIKYANQPLALNKKNGNTVECANYAELIGALKSVKDAVSAGELDGAIAAACTRTRKAFKRV